MLDVGANQENHCSVGMYPVSKLISGFPDVDWQINSIVSVFREYAER
mgnify:CR=1 FL=1